MERETENDAPPDSLCWYAYAFYNLLTQQKYFHTKFPDYFHHAKACLLPHHTDERFFYEDRRYSEKEIEDYFKRDFIRK